MYFGIYDSYRVRNLKLKGEKTILIRCLSDSEYQSPDIMIQNINDYSGVLQLNLQDQKTIGEENAKLLNDFIVSNNFDEIITHCSLGMSRSPAIMICVAKILQSEEMEQLVKENYRFYNKAIVKDFENFNYVPKKISDTSFILRESYEKDESTKNLIKKI